MLNLDNMKKTIINLLKKLDKLLCNFLGLLDCARLQSKPSAIIKCKNKFSVIITEPYSRAVEQCDLKDYIDNNLHGLSDEMRCKFGKAAGKALASNLTITFKD
jgi:hypothetical protein